MPIAGIFANPVLGCALVAVLSAQIAKVPVEYIRRRKWSWGWLFTAGGMPSSHSALISGTAMAIGLYYGFDTPAFALAIAVGMIIAYDAAGVRRQAGFHAERINFLFDELLKGHLWDESELREVLGHTPFEVLGGIIWGLSSSALVWFLVTR